MVQFTIHGITFGKLNDHWWDNLTIWDAFSNLNNWDVSVGGDVPGSVSVLGGNCTIIATDPGEDESSYAILTLKTALTSGKIIVFVNDMYITAANDDAFVNIRIGNDTDGWTGVGTLDVWSAAGAYTDFNGYKTSVECINVGGSNWDIYIGGVKKTTVTLYNGLKIKFYAYCYDYGTGSPYSYIVLDKVYKI